MKDKLIKVLQILSIAEKLKFELRHSWLSSGRQESVAEHTWRMSLIAILLEPYLEKPIDISKTLKMIIIHDLVEALYQDIPAFDTMNDEALKQIKMLKEREAIEKIRNTLDKELGQHVYDLWHEFEDKISYEAKVANAIDKLEVQLQHNEADISTWLEIEYDMLFMMDKHVDFDKTLQQFKDIIELSGEEKLNNAGIDTVQIKQKSRQSYT
ncbi:MAG: HD domain-containing protein [Daejeonella sp.]